jgi:hypothetical protein
MTFQEYLEALHQAGYASLGVMLEGTKVTGWTIHPGQEMEWGVRIYFSQKEAQTYTAQLQDAIDEALTTLPKPRYDTRLISASIHLPDRLDINIQATLRSNLGLTHDAQLRTVFGKQPR